MAGGEAVGRLISIAVSVFLIYAVLALGWSAGEMLVGIWVQTLVLWVLVALVALLAAARSHWGLFLVALPLVGFVFFVTGQFVNLFGMFAWGSWAEEHHTSVRMLSFNPFKNLWHFAQRTPQVLPPWQIAVLVVLQTVGALAVLLQSRRSTARGFDVLFALFHRRLFVNHLAVLIGAALGVVLGGWQAILLALLGLVLSIDLVQLIRVLRSAEPNGV